MSAESLPQMRTRHRPRWKTLLFGVLAAFLSVGLTDFLASLLLIARFGGLPSMEEISARTTDVLPRPVGGQLPFAATIHPYLGYVHTPLSTPQTTMAVNSLRIDFDEHNDAMVALGTISSEQQPAANRWGYLDSKSPLQRRADNKLIVGIIGGSVAENFSIEGASRLAEQLHRIDRFANREIEFVNLAVQGFKQPQQLLTMTYFFSLGAEFDVLINIDGFNELFISIFQNYERGVSPSYPLLWDMRLQIAVMDVDHLTIGRLAHAREQRVAAADFFVQYPWRHSGLAKCLWLAVNDSSGRQQARIVKLAAGPPGTQKSNAITGPYEPFASDEALYQHCVDVWQRGSLELERLCDRHGVAYYHFLQPNQYAASSKPMSTEESDLAITPDSPFHRIVSRGYPLLEAAGLTLQSQGVRFRSLTDIYHSHQEPLYKDNCCHVNRAGSQIMADVIAQTIAASP